MTFCEPKDVYSHERAFLFPLKCIDAVVISAIIQSTVVAGGSFLFYCTDLQGVLHWCVGVDGSAASAGRFNPGQASRGIIQAASSSIQMVGSRPSVGVEGASRLLGVGRDPGGSPRRCGCCRRGGRAALHRATQVRRCARDPRRREGRRGMRGAASQASSGYARRGDAGAGRGTRGLLIRCTDRWCAYRIR